MTEVRELTPEEFTDRLEPIFRDVESRVTCPSWSFEPGYFFPNWRQLMKLKVARTWEMPGNAVLGAIFSNDTFTGTSNAYVHFWFKRTGAPSAQPLLDVAESAARAAGCKFLHSATFAGSNSLERKYCRQRFEKTETVFRKAL